MNVTDVQKVNTGVSVKTLTIKYGNVKRRTSHTDLQVGTITRKIFGPNKLKKITKRYKETEGNNGYNKGIKTIEI